MSLASSGVVEYHQGTLPKEQIDVGEGGEIRNTRGFRFWANTYYQHGIYYRSIFAPPFILPSQLSL